MTSMEYNATWHITRILKNTFVAMFLVPKYLLSAKGWALILPKTSNGVKYDI